MSLMELRPTRRPRRRLWLPLLGIFLCAGLALGLAVISVFLSESEPEKSGKRTITYGLTLLPSGLDPHIHSSLELGIPFHNVYDTLVYRHPQTFDFVAGLAETWEISPDGLIYTFHLRQGVKFHDNTDFDANAVAVTLDRIYDPATGSQRALSLLGPYIGYVIVDPYTIEIRLSEAYTPLLDGLSQPYLGIASPTALANTTNADYQFHQVGTGPFKLTEFIPGDRIVLERNEDYAWGPPYYAEYSDKSVERVIFRFYVSPETRRPALEAGDVNIVGELSPTDAELLRGEPDLKLVQQAIPGQPLQFYFNTQQYPTDDLSVRQALIYATNRESIVGTVFFTQFSPTAYGPLSAVTPFYDTHMQTLYTYNLEQARLFFGRGGISDSDEDGLLDEAGVPIKLRVVFMGYGSLPDVAQIMQSQWREIGLEAELTQVATLNDLLEVVESGEYNLISFVDFGADPALLNRYYLSNGDRNWTNYSDPELDGWLLEASRSLDPASRQILYNNVQNRIMDQALILPIRDYVNLNGLSADVDGLIYTAQGWWPLLTNLVINE